MADNQGRLNWNDDISQDRQERKTFAEKAREYKPYIKNYLQGRGLPLDKMFRCINPAHTKDNTPSMSFNADNNTVRCFGQCGSSFDIFDLVGLEYNLTDKVEQLRKVEELYSLEAPTVTSRTNDLGLSESEIDKRYQALIARDLEEAPAHLEDTDYFTERGLSLETVKKFRCGYIANWVHPKTLAEGKAVPGTPRLIIPTGSNSYVARLTRPIINPGEQKAPKAGKQETLFNAPALNTTYAPVFVVEGEIDCMSIYELGIKAKAVALGSTSYWRNLVKALEKLADKPKIILALDNDEAGEKATADLGQELSNIGIRYEVINIAGDCKDCNEALLQNREAFKDRVYKAMTKDVYENSIKSHIDLFLEGVAREANTPVISTGFSGLDKALDGGLYEGLYILGAISSLGKTTFLLQVADYIASCGTDVLFYSLEMSRAELMSKSISRYTLLECMENKKPTSLAKTSRGITAGQRYKNYNKQELELIKASVQRYEREAGDHLFIAEALGDIGSDDIRKEVERYNNITGRRPVVIVDYLQSIAPYDTRATDTMKVSYDVKALKRLSRDFKIPVILISSLNRENYSKKANMTAFKQSGDIEYSADSLIGLQLKGTGANDFDVDKAKSKNPREVEAIILKNRNAQTGLTIDFEYYPQFNYYKEV